MRHEVDRRADVLAVKRRHRPPPGIWCQRLHTQFGDHRHAGSGTVTAGRERKAAAMQLGMVGLGRMGANLVRRLMRDGHECVVFDVNPDAVKTLVDEGAKGASSMDEFVRMLDTPRAAWVMVPAGDITESSVRELASRMDAGDVIIDGGNSSYRDDIRRAGELKPHGIHYVDVGTSGGVFGLERGFCLMIGAEDEVFARLEPLFATIAPGLGDIERTPGRTGEPAPE